MIFLFVFISIGTITVEFTFAQNQTKEEPQRNPFSLPSGVYLLSDSRTTSVTGETEKILETRVKAILISDHVRLALIDKHIVTVGDSINDEKILEIKPEKVILGKGNKKRTLFLYHSLIPLIIEEK